MSRAAILRVGCEPGTLFCMEDVEATRLMLETMFDMRAVVYEIRDVLIEPEDWDEETEEDA